MSSILHLSTSLNASHATRTSLRTARPARVAAQCQSVASSSSRRAFQTSARRMKQYADADAAVLAEAISKEGSAGKVVLVDFYADWCGPCKALTPILKKLESSGKTLTGGGALIDLVTVDVDAHSELAAGYKIRALPTVKAFKDGKVLSSFQGALHESQVLEFLQKL